MNNFIRGFKSAFKLKSLVYLFALVSLSFIFVLSISSIIYNERLGITDLSMEGLRVYQASENMITEAYDPEVPKLEVEEIDGFFGVNSGCVASFKDEINSNQHIYGDESIIREYFEPIAGGDGPGEKARPIKDYDFTEFKSPNESYYIHPGKAPSQLVKELEEAGADTYFFIADMLTNMKIKADRTDRIEEFYNFLADRTNFSLSEPLDVQGINRSDTFFLLRILPLLALGFIVVSISLSYIFQNFFQVYLRQASIKVSYGTNPRDMVRFFMGHIFYICLIGFVISLIFLDKTAIDIGLTLIFYLVVFLSLSLVFILSIYRSNLTDNLRHDYR